MKLRKTTLVLRDQTHNEDRNSLWDVKIPKNNPTRIHCKELRPELTSMTRSKEPFLVKRPHDVRE